MATPAKSFAFEDWWDKCPAELGRFLFERVPHGRRPAWARQLLLFVTDRVEFKPPQVAEVLRIASERREWPKAHGAFSAVRRLGLDIERRKHPEGEKLQANIFSLAELVAKVTYNASGEPAPFDEDSGWWIARAAQFVCKRVDDPELTNRVWLQLNTAGVNRDESAT